MVAAARTIAGDLAPHSLHAYFLLPGDTTVPIIYDVERLRDGRSFAARRVVARQRGQTIFFMSVSFQVLEDGFEHQDVAPQAPPPERCPMLGEVLERVSGHQRTQADWAKEWAALDLRYVGDSRPGGGLEDREHPARARVWLKAAGALGDDPLLHTCVLAYASDLTLLSASTVPHGTFIGSPTLQAASLDHAIWFHRPIRMDQWLLYDQISPSASAGRGLVTGRLFTTEGLLVASVAQEGLIRRRER